jgi:hypothetical protein
MQIDLLDSDQKNKKNYSAWNSLKFSQTSKSRMLKILAVAVGKLKVPQDPWNFTMYRYWKEDHSLGNWCNAWRVTTSRGRPENQSWIKTESKLGLSWFNGGSSKLMSEIGTLKARTRDHTISAGHTLLKHLYKLV